MPSIRQFWASLGFAALWSTVSFFVSKNSFKVTSSRSKSLMRKWWEKSDEPIKNKTSHCVCTIHEVLQEKHQQDKFVQRRVSPTIRGELLIHSNPLGRLATIGLHGLEHVVGMLWTPGWRVQKPQTVKTRWIEPNRALHKRKLLDKHEKSTNIHVVELVKINRTSNNKNILICRILLTNVSS